MSPRLHALAGAAALTIVAVFWTATVWSELSGDGAAIAAVKRSILWGMLGLIPAMAATGASGFVLSRGWHDPLVSRKLTRMKVAGANGILILAPCAFFLAARAGRGEFDTAFYAVQTVELIAGLGQLGLLLLNARDGLRLSGRRLLPTRSVG
jgi:hypothetical protein